MILPTISDLQISATKKAGRKPSINAMTSTERLFRRLFQQLHQRPTRQLLHFRHHLFGEQAHAGFGGGDGHAGIVEEAVTGTGEFGEVLDLCVALFRGAVDL